MRRIALLVACTLALALCAGTAFGQADTLKVDYFANANTSGAPDGTVRIDNPGTAAGNVCASIYVFDPEQELSECCSCLLTPDGLRTLSVNTDLTSNPLTGVVLSTGLIKFVSTIPVAGACPLPTTVKPEAACALGLPTSRTAPSLKPRLARSMPRSAPAKSALWPVNARRSSSPAAAMASAPAVPATSRK